MKYHLVTLLFFVITASCQKDFTMDTLLKNYDMTIPPNLDKPTGKVIMK